MSARVYLDYNATAPMRPEVREAVCEALAAGGNPSSVHDEGRHARGLIEAAREQVATLLGADPANVIFTSGGTEANVTALAPETVGAEPGGAATCVISAIEHPSVRAGGRFQAEDLCHVPVTGDGVVDVPAFAAEMETLKSEAPDRPVLVSVMVANNETGAIQPVSELAAIAHEAGAVVHADAVQAAGKVALDVSTLGADMISVSAHKIAGPTGVGVLVLDADRPVAPLLTGGGQERRRRAGTENVAGIVGFGVAADLARRDLETQAKRLGELRDRLERTLKAAHPDAIIFAEGAPRLANTSCFAVPGAKAETALIALDLAGIAVSAGAACSSGKVEPSHVLEAMGVGHDLAVAAIRVSLGWGTRDSDIDQFIAAWSRVSPSGTAERSAA